MITQCRSYETVAKHLSQPDRPGDLVQRKRRLVVLLFVGKEREAMLSCERQCLGTSHRLRPLF